MTASSPENPPSAPPKLARYVVGLDLGTTNSALAYVDTRDQSRRIRTFPVAQVVAAGQVEQRETLPSFHYEPATGELADESLLLPWGKKDATKSGLYAVGMFAREQGSLASSRMISSAKSWLCHPGIDRSSPVLPWHGAEDVTRLSPVEVSSRYLLHFRQAWDHSHPDDPLAEQDFILTIPASFDEVARELTVRAAALAGLSRVILIEEPQAAFYAWIARHPTDWDQLVTPGQKILVVDVGGGTSDFTLIRVRRNSEGAIQFHRVAVGDHLILGGDNFDLALAHSIEQQLKPNGQLEPRQWSTLLRSCRALKEVLLGENPPEEWTINLPGSGAKLIGGALQAKVKRADVEQLIMNGFFPEVPLTAKPDRESSGFREMGLPYAADPAITKYLASFLATHRYAGVPEAEQTRDCTIGSFDDSARPDIVLFNGGVFGSTGLKSRLTDAIANWFATDNSNWRPIVLENERLDLAVACGAAYYGMVRRGEGVRISAGLARTYYIGIEDPAEPKGLCLLPAGLEPGEEIDLSQRPFELRISQPIEFPLFVSSTRLTDEPGQIVTIDPESLKALPPIRTVLKSGRSESAKTIIVSLHARLTELGTLDLWCRDLANSKTWKLLFDVRSTTQTDVTSHAAIAEQQGFVDEETREKVDTWVGEVFSRTDPGPVMKTLAALLEQDRWHWPVSLMRQIWESLIAHEPLRRTSARHEECWLNMVGFLLRPGFGFALDDWRIEETWKRLHGKLTHATPACRAEWWILWRRIAGGLSAGQQQSLVTPLVSSLRQAARNPTKGISLGSSPHETAEICRLIGASESLPVSMKRESGQAFLDLLPNVTTGAIRTAMTWSIGRLGTRHLQSGVRNSMVNADVATSWIRKLMAINLNDPAATFAVAQMSRRTNDRFDDISNAVRSDVLKWMEQASASPALIQLVQEGGTLAEEEQQVLFGDPLPHGLRMIS